MDHIRNTVTDVLNNTANNRILVLNLPMSSFAAMIGDMQAILTTIKQQTGKVFVPICVSHSPVKPLDHFIIVLRTHENIHAFPLDSWFT